MIRLHSDPGIEPPFFVSLFLTTITMKHYTPLPSKADASNANDVEQQTKISDEPRLPFNEYLGRHFDVLGAKITDILGQDVSMCNVS